MIVLVYAILCRPSSFIFPCVCGKIRLVENQLLWWFYFSGSLPIYLFRMRYAITTSESKVPAHACRIGYLYLSDTEPIFFYEQIT